MRLRLKYGFPALQVMHAYEVRPRRDDRGVDLISDALPFGRLWYGEPEAADVIRTEIIYCGDFLRE
jgi:hypothetical protein